MDEVTLLARAVPDVPPPSAETVARARARLAAAHQAPARPRLPWGWTVGAAATAAVVTTVALLVSNLIGGPEPAPPPATPPTFEEAPQVYQGLDLLATAKSATSATKLRLSFRPTSTKIAIVVFCRQPGSIFYSNEGTSGAGGTCGPDGGLSMLADKAHEAGWLGRDHTITVWVFPPDAPVARGHSACSPRSHACERKDELSDPRSADRLAAALGERPGAWSVAAYDVPPATTTPSRG